NFTFWRMVSWMSLPPFANWKAVASHGWVPAAVGSSSSNSTSGSLTMLRVPMLDETEFESYGLKSCEQVTPVVGSAMSGLPLGRVDVQPARRDVVRRHRDVGRRLALAHVHRVRAARVESAPARRREQARGSSAAGEDGWLRPIRIGRSGEQ